MLSSTRTNAADGDDSTRRTRHSIASNDRNNQVNNTRAIDDTLIFGDTLDMDHDAYDGSILCLSLNINGLQSEKWKAKNDRLRTFLKNYNFDIMGFQETNLNWDKVEPKDQWDERTTGWWKGGHTSIKAFNKEDITSTIYQPGGCMIASVNSVKRKIIGCGVDTRRLGRWAWTRYQGKHELSVRVITAYRPGDHAGAHTVFSQQRSYFDNLDDTRHPRDSMLEELGEAIKSWQEEGDSIILLMDANENVSNDNMNDFFDELGMKEAILDRHHDQQDYQPTYHRGRDPIDGIFVSNHLDIEAAGYLPFGDSPSDHRGLWVKIKEDFFLDIQWKRWYHQRQDD